MRNENNGRTINTQQSLPGGKLSLYIACMNYTMGHIMSNINTKQSRTNEYDNKPHGFNKYNYQCQLYK